MASWHLFMQSRLQYFVLRRIGAFSIYREGMDRAALNLAVETLAQASRPLVIFPEGVISRTNDRLNPLLERTSFIPLEREWLKGEHDTHVVARIKKLRSAVLPDMIQKDLPEEERARRWQQLADMYLAGQLGCYPPDYLAAKPTPERLLETVERYE